jgi:hypothetical protein
MIRSVLAVLAGIAVLTATSFAIEALANPLMMRMLPLSLPDSAAISYNLPANLFLFAYTALSVAGGGYVTAWLVNRAPVRHAVILGIIQTAMTVWAMVSLPEGGPLRNWIATIVLTVPAAWCGGMLRVSRVRRIGSLNGNTSRTSSAAS